MEKVFFDTSVLVPLVTEQLEHHGAAHARFVSERNRGAMLCCSTHVLAECYSSLSAMPLPRRISGEEASRLLKLNVLQGMSIIDLSVEDYVHAIQLCAEKHRISGQVYDALHVVAAEKVGCGTLFTFNLSHFQPLALDRMRISVP